MPAMERGTVQNRGAPRIVMNLERLHSLESVSPAEWNALTGGFPFLRHEFLVALEHHGCLGEAHGWIPWYHLLHDPDDGHLAAAAPVFIKLNSWGEFVFDFAWADAWHRNGLQYYPKLVLAAPFTPATGPRLMLAPGHGVDTATELLQAIRHSVTSRGWSGAHCLFPQASELEWLRENEWLLRRDIQYHWHNHGYADFDDFLAQLNSRKRKKIRRERERVSEQGLTLARFRGDEMDDRQWALAHHFYASTFEKKWNIPALTLEFFREIGRTMGDRIVVVFASDGGREVAASILLQDETTLYGRYWGCDHDYHSLHFEACYYQGIEHAIDNGLQRFEPGAQGEHKIARGFLPVLTHSAHWIAHPDFRRAIADYLAREGDLVDQRHATLQAASPYRRDEFPSR